MDTPEVKKLKADNRNLRKHLKDIVASVTHYLAVLDQVMRGPSTVERGRLVARLSNALEMAKDMAIRYGLEMGRKESAG